MSDAIPTVRCSACGRVDDEVGNCGNFLGCPRNPVPVDPQKDIVLHCDFCKITRVVSAAKAVKPQRQQGLDVMCLKAEEHCLCHVISATPPAPSPRPAGDTMPVRIDDGSAQKPSRKR